MQRRAAGVAEEAASPVPSVGGGQRLPDSVRGKMESAFGSDFSKVSIHEGSHVSAIGARAYTQGTEIHFAPGQYQPESQRGQELLGHELTHVVQQSQGRVQTTMQAKGVDINDEPSLEREADDLGARAARGETGLLSSGGASPSSCSPVQASVVQRYTEVPVASQTATEWSTGFDLRVADDGMTLTSQVTSLKECYAHPDRIAQANRELQARSSGIELVEQSATVSGSAPNSSGRHTLKKVMPTIAASTSGGTGTGQSSWADCGRMSREVMGNAGTDTPRTPCTGTEAACRRRRPAAARTPCRATSSWTSAWALRRPTRSPPTTR